MKLYIRFIVMSLLLCIVTSQISQPVSAKSTDSGYLLEPKFKIQKIEKEVIEEPTGDLTITKTYVQGNLEEYIQKLKDSGQKIVDTQPNKQKLNFVATQSFNGSSSDFVGISSESRHNGALSGSIYAKGSVELPNGGLGGGKLSVDTAISNIGVKSGHSEFTDLASQVVVDWTLYGLVGGNAFVVYNYNKTSEWDTLISYSTVAQKAGAVAYSALNIYGNFKYKRYGTQYQFTIQCQLEEQ